jgi:hypothetical protein
VKPNLDSTKVVLFNINLAKKSKNYKFDYSVYDGVSPIAYSKSFELPLNFDAYQVWFNYMSKPWVTNNDNAREIFEVILDNEANIYLPIEVSVKKEEKSKGNPNVFYEIVRHNYEKNDLVVKKLNFDSKYYLFDRIITANKEGVLIFTSQFSQEKPIEQMNVELSARRPEGLLIKILDKNNLEELGSGQGLHKSCIYLKNIVIHPSGDISIIGEVFNRGYPQSNIQGSAGSRSLIYGPISITRFDSKGAFKWESYIGKYQEGSIHTQYYSYSLLTSSGKLYFIYNSNIRGGLTKMDDSFLMLASVENDGTVKEKKLFDNKEGLYLGCSDSYQVSNDEIVIYADPRNHTRGNIIGRLNINTVK